MARTKLRAALGIAATAAVAIGGAVVVTTAASAATGCAITYTIQSQWSGGFGANVNIKNLGDPMSSWTLKWTFPDANQKVTQGWNGTYTQSGTAVTVASMSYNGSLATNVSTSTGFNGSWVGSNPIPTSFTLNGVACTGAATTTAPTTAATTPRTTAATTAPTTPRTTAPTTPPTTGTPVTGWNPPSNLVSPLASVWSHVESTYSSLYTFRNYGWDQVMANKGSINYCVRWDTSASVTAAQRDQIQTALQRQVKKWMDAMLENGVGWNGWPYASVPVKVVGWAVRDRNQLQWTDTSVDVTVNNINENAPQCNPDCGRFFHQNGSYPNCPGGATHHYDMSLWLTAGFGGGAGGDWGQRVGSEYYMGAINSDNIHIVLHELGHSFGLDDFYDWDPTPGQGFIMKAGSATYITEFDKWMLRDFWRHLKSRYGL